VTLRYYSPPMISSIYLESFRQFYVSLLSNACVISCSTYVADFVIFIYLLILFNYLLFSFFLLQPFFCPYFTEQHGAPRRSAVPCMPCRVTNACMPSCVGPGKPGTSTTQCGWVVAAWVLDCHARP